MRIRRMVVTPLVAGAALAAVLLLVVSLTSAQLAQATPPLLIEGAVPENSISAPALISVTFPGGLPYAHPAITVHPKPLRAHHPHHTGSMIPAHEPINRQETLRSRIRAQPCAPQPTIH